MGEPNYVINPPRRKKLPTHLKKHVPDWYLLVRAPLSDSNPRKSNLEKQLEDDLKSLRIAMDYFIDGKLVECEEFLKSRSNTESMYFLYGVSLIEAIKALLTFNRQDIEHAMKSFEVALKVVATQRKKSTTFMGIGSVKAFGSWIAGSVGANFFKDMTKIERHAELVYAELLLFRAAFSIVYHDDFWELIEETVNFRTALVIFNGFHDFLDTVEEELKAGGNISGYHLDEHLITGIIFSKSVINICASFMPKSVIKLFNLVGIPTDRDWGHALLCTIGQWNPNALSFHESPWELQQRLASRTNEGLRRQIGDTVLAAIHTIAASFLPFKYVDYEFAEQVIDYNLTRFPNSYIFTHLKGRCAQVDTRLEEAVKIYDTIKVQPEFKNMGHSGVFEQIMIGIMLQDHNLTCEKSRILLRENNWSKTTFRYLAAITTLVRGLPHEAPRVSELMNKVELGVQTFCGVEVFTETYCVRKANRFLNEGHLLLPDYDFLLLWNGFDMMPMPNLRVALAKIMVEIQRLEALLPPTMLAISEDPIPKGGYTLEATKGILNSIRSSIHTLTKADKVPGYDHFYDDLCIAHCLLGSVAQRIALFPDQPFDVDMCALAVKSFKTVFRYAPYIKDDTYAYYMSHYSVGVIMMSQGKLDHAEEKFKYLLNTINPTFTGLTSILAGKGRNSLECMMLGKAHSALYMLNEDRASSTGSPCTSANGKSSPVSSEGFYDGAWTLTSATAIHINDINSELGRLSVKQELAPVILPTTVPAAQSMASIATLTIATSTVTTFPAVHRPERGSIVTAPHLANANSPLHF